MELDIKAVGDALHAHIEEIVEQCRAAKPESNTVAVVYRNGQWIECTSMPPNTPHMATAAVPQLVVILSFGYRPSIDRAGVQAIIDGWIAQQSKGTP